MKKKEEEKENPSLTSLSTKTWFKTHIGSISFKTEHKLVNLCIAASNLSLKTVDKLKEYNYWLLIHILDGIIMTYILIEPLFSGKLSWPGKGKPAVPFGDLYDGMETLDV